eukprot:CAMPEP_0206368312 /NCGR_PEP_ID=MMETSP0294-20121207/4595_1 /ASSEMBLY_ACC=CAM_ASM_000327 /TAXON_ID=39354 /ORGANISM="Heterosigma akashiwo, Strain CCMP2393" /LENGTH=86 /DNA_ID=CAMNT_0053814789 /DNA_START=320 /DNA_END=581 /DNA_ORIENTATION=+
MKGQQAGEGEDEQREQREQGRQHRGGRDSAAQVAVQLLVQQHHANKKQKPSQCGNPILMPFAHDTLQKVDRGPQQHRCGGSQRAQA